MTLEAVLWERQVYDANRSFQEQISAMREMDLVVGIIGKRIASELPPDRFLREDASPYESGTVFELETALACDGRPPVYVFKKTAKSYEDHETKGAKRQHDLLTSWWSRTFHDAEGHYLRGYEPFVSTAAFEERLKCAIENWLDIEGLVSRGPIWDITKQSPFPGLQAYDRDRASVFFVRDLAIGEAVELLLQNIISQDHRPVLLIIGASGSGKSSLARAGIMPRLMTPGIVSGVDDWVSVIVEPTGDMLGELACRLYEALPVLAKSLESTSNEWRERILAQPHSVGSRIVWALNQMADGDQRGPQLILLLDQLETLLADPNHGVFAKAVRSMVEQAGVCLVATLRSDRYADLQNQQDLRALKWVGIVYDLPPAGRAEIGAIVRGPAAAAGLALEVDNKRSLSTELAKAASSACRSPLDRSGQ